MEHLCGANSTFLPLNPNGKPSFSPTCSSHLFSESPASAVNVRPSSLPDANLGFRGSRSLYCTLFQSRGPERKGTGVCGGFWMGAVLHMAIIIHGAPCLVSPRSERREGKMKKRKEGAVWRKCGRKSLCSHACSRTRRRRMRQSAPGVRDLGSAELPPLIGGTESREWARKVGVVAAAGGS